MNTHKLIKVLSIVIGFTVLLSGCANYLKPEMGVIAQQEARIELATSGMQDGVWNTKDLELNYSFTKSGDSINLNGKLVFDRSLTDSFPLAKKFIFKMSFLDSEGRVLSTVDVSPLITFSNDLSSGVNVISSNIRPKGSVFIAFNYYGEFRGGGPEQGSNDESIFYFPYGKL